jgi:hypothetical protein
VVLNRNQFFLLLLILLLGPFVGYKLIWIAKSRKTLGIMEFTGHDNLGSALGISTYPVIRFRAGRDSVEFRGNIDLPLKRGESIFVRYQKNDPPDAKINMPICLWGDTLAYILLPSLFLLVLYLKPDIIPKKSKVKFGRYPFIRVLDS